LRKVRAPSGVGVEGQRAADLGNGFYQNPVLAGDHPDPSILKDGDIYYAAFSSFDYSPGLPLWQSRDLVNWAPVGTALPMPLGSVYAPDLVKHGDRYFIYFPVLNYRLGPSGLPMLKPGRPLTAVYVIHAPSMHGPWSLPVDLKIAGAIDPGHAVGEDGKRYLFLNEGRRIRLTDDGLATDGKLETVYAGWKYPADWVVEGYTLEGPKISRRAGWFYMTSAVGGTGGPPTGHMVIVARSRSINGPWQDCPHNPIVRTQSIDEPWWSRGHATIVEGPGGSYWLAYHGIEKNRRTLGRQLLLEPMTWTSDGWPRAGGGDLRAPLRKPRGVASGPSGRPLSGPFSLETMGIRFPMFGADSAADLERVRFEAGTMVVPAQGKSPADCNPLGAIVGDPHYELSVEVETTGTAQGGLILFYSRRAYCGLGSDGTTFSFPTTGPGLTFAPGERGIGRRFHLRVVNNRDVASFYHSVDGERWTLYRSAEVAGLNHNVFNEFLSLRPALYASGEGDVRFSNARYRAFS
jgi:xylan 1,4-beta-xylosidase